LKFKVRDGFPLGYPFEKTKEAKRTKKEKKMEESVSLVGIVSYL